MNVMHICRFTYAVVVSHTSVMTYRFFNGPDPGVVHFFQDQLCANFFFQISGGVMYPNKLLIIGNGLPKSTNNSKLIGQVNIFIKYN